LTTVEKVITPRDWYAATAALITIALTYTAAFSAPGRFGWYEDTGTGDGAVATLLGALAIIVLAAAALTTLMEIRIREGSWLVITAGFLLLVFVGEGRFWFCGPLAAVFFFTGLPSPGWRAPLWRGVIGMIFSWVFLSFGTLMLIGTLDRPDPVTWETGQISAYVFAFQPRWIMIPVMLALLLGGAALYSDALHSAVAPLAGLGFAVATIWANLDNFFGWRHGTMSWPEMPLWGFDSVERFGVSFLPVFLGGILAGPLLWRGMRQPWVKALVTRVRNASRPLPD
jgi:hypothetical protein